jgi:predicted ATPase
MFCHRTDRFTILCFTRDAGDAPDNGVAYAMVHIKDGNGGGHQQLLNTWRHFWCAGLGKSRASLLACRGFSYAQWQAGRAGRVAAGSAPSHAAAAVLGQPR